MSLAHVWPAKERDWVEFGIFQYKDERSVQTFKNDLGVVGRYAKLEVISHHGTEHYCPISLFKVFGISEIDLITEDMDPDPVEDDDDDEDDPKDNIIVQTIKNAVHKVVNVFRPKNVTLALQVLNPGNTRPCDPGERVSAGRGLPETLHPTDLPAEREETGKFKK